MAVIVNAPNGPFSVGSTPRYTGQLVDINRQGLPLSAITTLTLTIIDTATDEIINGVNQINILNNDRGIVDNQGNIQITLHPGDTNMDNYPGSPQVKRSLVIDWTSGPYAGGHRVDFIVVNLNL